MVVLFLAFLNYCVNVNNKPHIESQLLSGHTMREAIENVVGRHEKRSECLRAFDRMAYVIHKSETRRVIKSRLA